MQKTYRAVSGLLACTVLLAGSGITANAEKGEDETGAEASYTVSGSLVAAEIEEKLSQTDEVTEEQAEQVKTICEVEESVGSELEETAVASVDDYVNVRESADQDSESVGKLYDGAVAVVLEEEDDWCRIQSGSVEGYVRTKYLVIGDLEAVQAAAETVATVTADALRVREEASSDSGIVTLAAEGDDLEILSEEQDGWIAVTTSEGDGYVSVDYVEITEKYETALSREEEEELEAEEAASRGEAVAAYAGQFVGNPYVWGGTSLTNGADCSGFVMSVYAHFGISLPHSSAAMRSVGTEVDRSDIQAGDIVCYDGHVGIYAGNNTLVHASNSETGITYTYGIDYREIITIRRVL